MKVLGTGTVASQKMRFFTYDKAKGYVHKLNFSGKSAWYEYCKSGNKPNFLPGHPPRYYKRKGTWIGWGDWLGTDTIKPGSQKYQNFKVARKFVHELKLKNSAEWFTYCKSNNKPKDIPVHPDRIYEDFRNMGDWLGTYYVATFNRKYRDFNKARQFARSLHLKSVTEWRKYAISGKKPDDIPSKPDYINDYTKSWKSWNDWLGKN